MLKTETKRVLSRKYTSVHKNMLLSIKVNFIFINMISENKENGYILLIDHVKFYN